VGEGNNELDLASSQFELSNLLGKSGMITLCVTQVALRRRQQGSDVHLLLAHRERERERVRVRETDRKKKRSRARERQIERD
jgi:hypothetical protein